MDSLELVRSPYSSSFTLADSLISIAARTAGRTVPIAATHIYQMSFFTGFGVSALIYCGLNYFFPPRGSHFVGSKFEEVDVSEADDVEDDRQSDTEKADGKEGRADVLVYEA